MQKQGMTGGTVGERMAALGKDPAQLYPNTAAGREQLLAYLNGRIADVRTRLPRAFATMVPGRLVIKRVPPAIEAGAPGGYAAAGSIDGKVPGQYYINLRDTAEWPKFSLPTLCYHEGIPGHVWQGDYANRMPLIRSMLAFNAYSEGWALYAEQLADELGVYADDPLGQLGYLQSMGFRACRLVVDTGLHAMKWTRDQAIDWFVKTNGDDRALGDGEVDRYCAMPGQACGYKVGQLEIVRLRDKAKAALGAKYRPAALRRCRRARRKRADDPARNGHRRLHRQDEGLSAFFILTPPSMVSATHAGQRRDRRRHEHRRRGSRRTAASPSLAEHRAEQRRRDQPAGARDGAVEARRHRDMLLLDRAEHRRGQRRDGDGHADRHHQDRREGAGPIAAVGLASAGDSSHARRATISGPTVSGMRGPIRAASLPIVGRGGGHQDRQRQHREARLDRRIAAAGDQHVGDQQHRRREGAVEQEGQQVEARRSSGP